MSTTFPSLTVENSVKDAADLFYKNRTSYLPVVDGRGVLLGELTVLDLFRIGMPDYASKIGSLKFLKSFEPFDTLLRDESTILLGTVMKKPSITIEEDAPVVEAILKFTQSNRRHIPVVKEGRIIGVVNYMDILQKVLRA
jgi:CBS domain-containing protein